MNYQGICYTVVHENQTASLKLRRQFWYSLVPPQTTSMKFSLVFKFCSVTRVPSPSVLAHLHYLYTPTHTFPPPTHQHLFHSDFTHKIVCIYWWIVLFQCYLLIYINNRWVSVMFYHHHFIGFSSTHALAKAYIETHMNTTIYLFKWHNAITEWYDRQFIHVNICVQITLSLHLQYRTVKCNKCHSLK